mgnify:CR=1 FL=1
MFVGVPAPGLQVELALVAHHLGELGIQVLKLGIGGFPAGAAVGGWCRNGGGTTLVPMAKRRVSATSEPSHANEYGACPPVCFHGWK